MYRKGQGMQSHGQVPIPVSRSSRRPASPAELLILRAQRATPTSSYWPWTGARSSAPCTTRARTDAPDGIHRLRGPGVGNSAFSANASGEPGTARNFRAVPGRSVP